MTAQIVKETELICLTKPSGKVNETMINNAENQLHCEHWLQGSRIKCFIMETSRGEKSLLQDNTD